MRQAFWVRLLLVMALVVPQLSIVAPVTAVAEVPPAPTPLVAVHVSEYTKALNGTVQSPAPSSDVRGMYYDSFSHELAYTMLEEALRSDGTPFVELSDADIENGALLREGVPAYPIVFSLMAESVSDTEVGRIRDYVSAGGHVYVGGSSWIRRPDGTFREDAEGTAEFPLSAEMGLKSVALGPKPQGGTWSWGEANVIRRTSNDEMVSHLTAGEDLSWPLPRNYDSDAVDDMHGPGNGAHLVWATRPASQNPATVLAEVPQLHGSTVTGVPLIATKRFGSGQFVYHAEMAPLAGWGGLAPDTSEYVFFRNAIESAFRVARVPLVRLAAWRYEYTAALQTRWDCDFYDDAMRILSNVEAPYRVLGLRGQYYVVTSLVDDNAGIVRTLQAQGAVVASHNDQHIGPDIQTAAEAANNISTSLGKLRDWTGVTPDHWVAPAYRSVLDESFALLEQQGMRTAGEQNIGPFPHYSLSMTRPGEHYDVLQIPTSEWLPSSADNPDARARMDLIPEEQIPDVVDFYYSMGSLINLYGHPYYSNVERLQSYLSRAASKGDVWFTHASEIADWWRLRDAVSIAPSAATSDGRVQATVGLTGAVDPNTAVDLLPAGLDPTSVTDVQVMLDGSPSAAWRLTAQGLKVRVGTASTAVVSWMPLGADTTPPAAPTAVTATDLGTGGSIRVAWTNPTADFAYSRVYRSTTAGTLGTRIADSVTASTYTDTGLTDGTVYHYTVRAVDASGNESVNTAQSAATPSSPPPDTTPPAAPTAVTATDLGTGGSIRVAWTNPTADFAYSRVYRSTTAGTLGTRIADSVTASTYTDTGLTDGTVYHYTVRAVDASGNESVNTAQSAATPSSPPPDTTPPAAPTAVTATDLGTGGSIRVAWTNPTADFAYSRVYRSTTAGTLGTRIADSVTASTYTDTGLTDGTVYHYTVRAVDASGNESVNTAQSAATPSSPPPGTQNMALKFDGVDDLVTVPYNASLNTPGALTVEAWVYVNTFKGQPIIASRWDGTQISWDLYYSDDGRVRFYVRTPGGNGYVQATTGMRTLRVGGWRHVVGVLDPAAAALRIYVDGTLAATQAYTAGSANSTTSRLFINGAIPAAGATGYGDNLIDEVRVSNSVRYTGTSFTPSPTFVPDTSTIGLWHFNEGVGTTVLDSGANGNHGALTGGPLWVVGQDGGTPPPPDTTPPAAPTAVTATDLGTGGSIRVAWTNPTADFAYSRVYRSTTAGTLGTRIADSVTASTYTDTGLTDGTVYHYTVRAVDASGNESVNTAQSAATPSSPPPDTTPPAAPTAVTATDLGTGGSIRVAWTNPTADFAYSRVYRSTTAGTLGTRIADSVTASTYTDTGLTDGTVYHYTVRAVDASGNESVNTAQSAATPSSPPPDTTPPAAPTAVTATDLGTGGSIRVAWTNPTADFAYSRVYRSTTAGTLGTRIADSVTASTYTDTGLTDGTVYHYTVRAVDASGNESVNTAQSAATPSSPPPGTQNMALKFDGVDDLVTVPYNASLNTPGALTVEAWVYVNTFKGQPIIASRWDGTQISWDLYYSDDGRVRFYVRTPGGNGYVQATTGMRTLRVGGWRHVVGVLDPAAAALRIYVDGTLAATQAYTAGSANSTTSRLFINGAIPAAGATGYGDNLIDEVRVSNSVRYTGTSFTPSPTFVPDTSTIGLWHFNEGVGTTVLDSGANGNHGALTGGPLWVLR